MSWTRTLLSALATCAALAGAPPLAAADAPPDVGAGSPGFHLTQTATTVSQDAGNATVTIARSDTRNEAQIHFLTLPGSAIRGQDYTPVNSVLDFQPGQSTRAWPAGSATSGRSCSRRWTR